MAELEARIKEFVRDQGVEVVGIAGPGRLDGPPSLDPTYCMKGAKSIVSMAIPMDTSAIYDFLSKRSPTPHNVDQSHGNQRMHRVSQELAGFIAGQGYRAVVVPPNNTYRRSPDIFSTHPSFSHRFGAIASGVGAQGWSGNVMTREYGASVYLGTVLTDALLRSDEALPPRHFVDFNCASCKVCARTCVAGMFESEGEEYVLLNDELHPRARRRNIDLCNASCFGLHALSQDREWTTWGPYWISEWVGRRPGAGRIDVRHKLMRYGGATGDSATRFELIRRTGKTLFPPELMDALPLPDELPEDQAERNRILREHAALVGVTGFADPNVLTCGQCALVCGPTVAETRRRFDALADGGLVVRGAKPGEMVRASTYSEALELRAARPRLKRSDLVKDQLASMVLWHRRYFGFEPRSIAGGISYQMKLKKALRRSKA
jgi:ferredoxin